MVYRTKTYLAGDWDGDKDAIDKIHEWKDSHYYSKLDFVDVHEFRQARDSSLPCTIKNSLHERMNMCKTFVLVVGNHTKNLTKGSCYLCSNHLSIQNSHFCKSNHAIDDRSYVDYECEQAVKQGLRIVILYNACKTNKSLCPDILVNKGIHVAMKCCEDGHTKWNYSAVMKAILGICLHPLSLSHR